MAFELADKPAKLEAGHDRQPLHEGLYEVNAQQVLDALCDAREEWASPEDQTDFKWDLRGGLWCQAHSGVPFDSVRGSAASTDAREFGRVFHFTQTATFTVG